MSNKKQTAVEWLIKKLQNRQNGIFDGFPHLSLDEIFKQAKELEKQQIIDAFWQGDNSDCTSEQNSKEFAEHFYNETYGGNNG